LGRGELLQEDVRVREPVVRGALLRDGTEPAAYGNSRDPRGGRLPARAAPRVPGEPAARHAAEGRPRQGAPDLARPVAARRAGDRSRPTLEARGAGVDPLGA